MPISKPLFLKILPLWISKFLAMTAVPIVFRVLDLADSQDEALIDALGVSIPILLTQDQMMLYPFGLMDVMNLLK